MATAQDRKPKRPYPEPHQEPPGREARRAVEKADRRALLIPGDLLGGETTAG